MILGIIKDIFHKGCITEEDCRVKWPKCHGNNEINIKNSLGMIKRLLKKECFREEKVKSIF